MHAHREKEAVKDYCLEHGLDPSLAENNEPHDALDLFKFRREPKPAEKRKTVREVVDKAREIQGVLERVDPGTYGSPFIKEQVKRREEFQRISDKYAFGKQFYGAHSRMEMANLTYPQLRKKYADEFEEWKKRKAEEENEDPNAR